jgi:hypothetical protein
MKTFFQWCEERNFDLDSLKETPPTEKATSESGSAKRAAVRTHAYPPGYGRGQYPKSYFQPSVADNLAYNKD